MTNVKIFLGFLFFIYLIIALICYKKSGHFFKMIFIIAFQGICSLFAVNFIGNFINLHIPVNYHTIGFSSAFGICGVIFLLLSEVFVS